MRELTTFALIEFFTLFSPRSCITGALLNGDAVHTKSYTASTWQGTLLEGTAVRDWEEPASTADVAVSKASAGTRASGWSSEPTKLVTRDVL